MLQPSNQWQWQVDSEKRLLLDIDPSMAFTTAYNTKQLTMEVLNDTSFSLEDAIYYQDLTVKLQQLGQWTIPEMVQIALNATAANRYYKPVMPKSWFFKINDMALHFGESVVDLTVVLYTEYGAGHALNIQQTGNATLCMLLEESLPLSEDKALNRFEIIKVMNDRLFSSQELKQLKYA